MTSKDGVQKNIGDKVWIPAYEGKDTFLKPILKTLQPNYQNFYSDFQNCVEHCKTINAKK